ncbi:MAG: hypothetical protein K0R08_8 [Solimicrobium sp.]|jgi:hypothetical protein|nr:hypothetical protein [Solimicrobium sp.]
MRSSKKPEVVDEGCYTIFLIRYVDQVQSYKLDYCLKSARFLGKMKPLHASYCASTI